MSRTNTAPAPGHGSNPGEPGSTWRTAFTAHRWLPNAHLQTIAGNFIRTQHAILPPPEELRTEVLHTPETDPGAAHAGYPSATLVSLCHWQPEQVRAERPTVVLLHGLEGSAHSRYMLGNAQRAWAMGWNAVRMNMRSCGASEELCPSIYHSGRSGDVAAVLDHLVGAYGLQQIAVIGYSMGGNLMLKYAGEAAPPPQLKAVVGVSPLMDLAPSSGALREPANRFYQWRFLRSMKARLRRKAALFPALYGSLEAEGVLERIRTMHGFDQEIVARFGGFAGAEDYYERVRSSRYASKISTPTLILHSLDDPFIRTLPSTREALHANPAVTLIETSRGGHCAFLTHAPDPHWAEQSLFGFLRERFAHPVGGALIGSAGAEGAVRVLVEESR